MTDHATRLVAHAPNGARLGVLPDALEFSATTPLDGSTPGALTVTYSRATRGGTLMERRLTEGLEIALEEWTGSQWMEVRGGRYVVVKHSEDFTDRTATLKLEAPHYSWLLSKIKHQPDPSLLAADGDNEGRRQFIGVNAGTVILTLLDEYAKRGGPVIDCAFTTAHDSRGQFWPQLSAFWVSEGEALDVTLGRLISGGSVDVYWQGRTLHAHPVRDGRDLTETVVLHAGHDIAESPSSETIQDLIQSHTMLGSGDLRVTDVDPSAPSPWGRWEGWASDDRYTTTEGARLRNQTELANCARLRGEYTRDLTPLCRHRIGVDILPGDWITAPTYKAGERVRVASLLWRLDSDGLTRSLILNDSLLSAELTRARKQRLGDGGSAGEGSTIRPTPEGQDKRTPAKVEGLVLATTAYLDTDGAARGMITATWGEVTTARPEDGGGFLEVDRYEIAVRRNVAGAPWQTVATVDTTEAELAPYDPGTELLVRVRARGTYATKPGLWSDPAGIVVAGDATPPPVPSLPVLESTLGTATATWDGLTIDGADQPLDYSHTDAEWRVTRDGVVETVADQLFGPGYSVVGRLDRASTAEVRLRSVDRSGNASDWTAWASVQVASVLDDTGLTERLAKLNQDLAELSEGGDALIADGSILARHLAADSVTANAIAAGAVETEHLTAGAVKADHIAAGALDFKTAQGLEVTSGVYRTTSEVNRGLVLDSSGLRAWNSAGTETFNLSAVDGSITAKGGTFIGSSFRTSSSLTTGLHLDSSGLRAFNRSGTETFNLSASDGSVTARGGTFTGSEFVGGTITGSVIQTARTGDRVVLGRNGLPIIEAFAGGDPSPRALLGVQGGQGRLVMRDRFGTVRAILNEDNQLSMYDQNGGRGYYLWVETTPSGTPWMRLYGPQHGGKYPYLDWRVDGQLRADMGVTNSSALVRIEANGRWHLGSTINGSSAARLTGSGTSATLNGASVTISSSNLRLSSGRRIDLAGAGLIIRGTATTSASSPTLVLVTSTAGDPILYRSTSLRAAKADIRDIRTDPRLILDLPVRDWIDKGLLERAETNPGTVIRRTPGVVAEEVLEHGLEDFCAWDDAGTLVGVQYDRLPLLLIPIVRDLVTRIDTLERTLA